jgi:PEP-CTERM motif
MNWKVLGLAAVIAMAGTSAAKADLIVNGGFETGNFSGWTLSGNTGFTGVSGPGFNDGFVNNPNSGNFFAFLGPVGSDGFLSQTFSDTAGKTLHVSFFLANDGDTPNDFHVSFDGTSLLSLTNDSAHAFEEFSFLVTATGSDTLTIGGFRNDPGYFGLDDVSVTVPEPTSIALFGAGLVALGFMMRRRKRA